MINFRYTSDEISEEALDLLHERISERILASGYAAVIYNCLKWEKSIANLRTPSRNDSR